MDNGSDILLRAHTLAGVPVLHAAPAAHWDAPLPTVLLYHGFTRSKELDSNLACMLAQAGLRAVMPEAEGHGARFDGDSARRLHRFWDIVRNSIDEMPALRTALVARGWAAHNQVAVAGLSMGGFIALGALARHEGLQAGVSWMGSGRYLALSRTLYPPLGATADDAAHATAMAPLAEYDPERHLERLARQPLLLWHGQHDEIVPFSESAGLQQRLQALSLDEQLEFVADAQAGHKLNEAGARCGVHFLQRVLQAPALPANRQTVI